MNSAVIIGRWQILQRGHVSLLRAALAAAPRVVIVIGSSWRARDPRNPFTWQERQQQFEAVLTPDERARVSFLPVRDYFDDERWGEAVRDGVAKLTSHGDPITLVGYKKDQTSSYLDNFRAGRCSRSSRGTTSAQRTCARFTSSWRITPPRSPRSATMSSPA